MAQEKVRVLIRVSGGVAEAFAPDFVDVQIVDFDDFLDANEANEPCEIPESFRSLAEEAGFNGLTFPTLTFVPDVAR